MSIIPIIIGLFLILFIFIGLPIIFLIVLFYLLVSPPKTTPNPFLQTLITPTTVSPQPRPNVRIAVPHDTVIPQHISKPSSQCIEEFSRDSNSKKQSFIKKKLLTKTEHKFLLCLMQARPEKIAIACKVGLWGVVHNHHKWDWNKISQKHLDFVLYDYEQNNILLVIELDDSSHQKTTIQQRDKIKDDILNNAGIPILRIPVSDTYNVNNLREKIVAMVFPDE